tara:strand:- start:420 stop:779 length:360 start_codon:yes stop_codon:yes gene_type:complete
MPAYDYCCKNCLAIVELIISFEKIDEIQVCSHCGHPLQRQIPVPGRHASWSGTYTGYYDRGLGCYIEDYHHREKVMAEKGVRPLESNENTDNDIDDCISDALNHNEQVKNFMRTGEYNA